MAMISEEILKDALTMAYDQEIDVIEKQASLENLHSFSKSYRARMQNIARMAKRKYVTIMHKRRRLALVVAAVIIMMLAAAVTTLAIVRPQIFYKITKDVGAWNYKFLQEDPNEAVKGFEYKKPVTPDGYTIEEENKDADIYSYDIYYTNNAGKYITYNQEGLEKEYDVNITDTMKKVKEITINNEEAIVFEEEDVHLILWNDGYYVYSLAGNCEEKELIEMAESI